MNLSRWRGKKENDESRDITWGSPPGQIRSEIDRLFDRLVEGPWFPEGWGLSTTMPALDMSENDQEISIRAEIPGVDPKDMAVEVVGQMLTLSGQKSETRENKGETYHHSERRFGSFRRSVELPASADTSRIAAEHKAGVLTIRVRKLESATPKRVSVKVSSQD